MKFEPEYFEGEIRGGFYVQPIMKRIWAAQLEVLDEIDRICRKHQIKYIAAYGTLLGAVRHKGFIPWDDDMDICMLRKDYERFLAVAGRELPEGWKVLSPRNGNFDQPLTRIVNSDQKCRCFQQEFLERFHNCPYPVGIDIFSLDNVPDDEALENDMVSMEADIMLAYDDLQAYDVELEKAEARLREVEGLTGQHFDRTKDLIPQLLHLADRVCSMYWDESTERVALLSYMEEPFQGRWPMACFDKIIRIPFENTTIPVVEDYDLLLSSSYGKDYMEPRCALSSHEYPLFKRYADEWERYFNDQGLLWPEIFRGFYRKDGRPLISIVIPCIQEKRIDRCLASLFCQSIVATNLEIICIVGKSAAGITEKLKKWEKRLGDIMLVIECDENITWGEAGNIGLEYAAADYVAFVEMDDWVEIDYLEKLYRPLRMAGFDVVACSYQLDASDSLSYFENRETGEGSRALLIDSKEKRDGFLHLFSLGKEVFGKIIKRQLLVDNQIFFPEEMEAVALRFEVQLHLYVKSAYLHGERLYHHCGET